MTVYMITVNGKEYEVVVQKKQGGASPQINRPSVAAPAPTPSVAPTPALAAAPPAAGSPTACAGESRIMAPMPGKVIGIKVNVGDTVKKNQELLVLEAMKMHNSVLSPQDGVVTAIEVQTGDPIQTGKLLVVIRS